MWKFESQFPNAKLKIDIVLSNLTKLAVIAIVQVAMEFQCPLNNKILFDFGTYNNILPVHIMTLVQKFL